MLVLFLGPEYGFDPAQKFLLTTVPAAVGAAVRIPYTFAVARFGGRNWTVVSAALLLVPCVLGLWALRPGVSFGTLLAVAAVAGVGGGNFASSMANIDAFYPQRLKGWALGLNAGGGNIGVAAVQLVGLAVLATAGAGPPRALIVALHPADRGGHAGAYLFMDNLGHVRNDRRRMREVARHATPGSSALLYIGTFGSFIGFGFAFGQVLQVQFAGHVRHADQGRLPDVPRPAARLARPARRRPARRPGRRLAGDAVDVRRHGRGGDARPGRLAQRLAGLFVGGFIAPVRAQPVSATARRTR